MASSDAPPEKRTAKQVSESAMAALHTVCAYEETRELVELRKLYKKEVSITLRAHLENVLNLLNLKKMFAGMHRLPGFHDMAQQNETISATLRESGMEDLSAERLEKLLNDKAAFDALAEDVVKSRME